MAGKHVSGPPPEPEPPARESHRRRATYAAAQPSPRPLNPVTELRSRPRRYDDDTKPSPPAREAPVLFLPPATPSRWPELDLESGIEAGAEQAPVEGRWPQLGRWTDQDTTITPLAPHAAFELERQRRLDREQRGH